MACATKKERKCKQTSRYRELLRQQTDLDCFRWLQLALLQLLRGEAEPTRQKLQGPDQEDQPLSSLAVLGRVWLIEILNCG